MTAMAVPSEVHLVEDVTRRVWWPYGTSDEGALRIDSLWMPADPDDEGSLLSLVGGAWSSLEWLITATWWEAVGRAGAGGLAERYPSLVVERIAQATVEPSRGRVSRTEWCVANPASTALHDFLSVIRRGRGKNGCLTLAGPDGDRATWRALSVSVLWRALLAVEPADFQDLQRKLSIEYLTLAVKSNLLPVVPLDYHPAGGYAIFGCADRLVSLSQAIPGVRLDQEEKTIVSTFSSGGGLAL